MNNKDFDRSTQQMQDKIIATHDLLWPDEDVIRFFARTFGALTREARASLRVMDLGFGTGRHLYYLGTEGYQLHGLDYAASAIAKSLAMLKAHRMNADLRSEDIRLTTFASAWFHAILAWGVLYLGSMEQIRANMIKVADLLLPDGWLCAKFRTTNNWFYGLGKEAEPNGYFLDERAGVYAGNYYHFFSKEELIALTESVGLSVENLEYKEWHKFGREVHSYWILWARKKASG